MTKKKKQKVPVLTMKSPNCKATMTMELLSDIEKYHGKDIVKDFLYEVYKSITVKEKLKEFDGVSVTVDSKGKRKVKAN